MPVVSYRWEAAMIAVVVWQWWLHYNQDIFSVESWTSLMHAISVLYSMKWLVRHLLCCMCGFSLNAISTVTCTFPVNQSSIQKLFQFGSDFQKVSQNGTFEDCWSTKFFYRNVAPVDLIAALTAPCGLRGCKNWPASFPGRMSYKATKPGLVSVLYLSMFLLCWCLLGPLFMYC